MKFRPRGTPHERDRWTALRDLVDRRAVPDVRLRVLRPERDELPGALRPRGAGALLRAARLALFGALVRLGHRRPPDRLFLGPHRPAQVDSARHGRDLLAVL